MKTIYLGSMFGSVALCALLIAGCGGQEAAVVPGPGQRRAGHLVGHPQVLLRDLQAHRKGGIG